MLAPIQGQHTIALARAARSDASCSAAAPTGQTGMVDQSDRSRWGQPDKNPTNARLGRTPSGQAHLGLPYTRQASYRASSNAIETKEEQYVEVEKVRVWIKGKDDKSKRLVLCLIDWIPSIGRGPLYL